MGVAVSAALVDSWNEPVETQKSHRGFPGWLLAPRDCSTQLAVRDHPDGIETQRAQERGIGSFAMPEHSLAEGWDRRHSEEAAG